MITIEKLEKVSHNSLDEINELVHQLSPRLPSCSMELLEKIVTSENLELWVARDQNRIIGMGTLAIVSLPEGERAQI